MARNYIQEEKENEEFLKMVAQEWDNMTPEEQDQVAEQVENIRLSYSGKDVRRDIDPADISPTRVDTDLVGLMERGLLKNLGPRNETAMAEMLKKRDKSLHVGVDDEGNALVYDPGTKKWHYVDPPGFGDAQEASEDITDMLVDAGLGVAGTIGVGGISMATSPVGGAVSAPFVGATLEGARQGLGQISGLHGEYVPGDIALVGAGEGAGQLAAPLLKAGSKVAQKGAETILKKVSSVEDSLLDYFAKNPSKVTKMLEEGRAGTVDRAVKLGEALTSAAQSAKERVASKFRSSKDVAKQNFLSLFSNPSSSQLDLFGGNPQANVRSRVDIGSAIDQIDQKILDLTSPYISTGGLPAPVKEDVGQLLEIKQNIFGLVDQSGLPTPRPGGPRLITPEEAISRLETSQKLAYETPDLPKTQEEAVRDTWRALKNILGKQGYVAPSGKEYGQAKKTYSEIEKKFGGLPERTVKSIQQVSKDPRTSDLVSRTSPELYNEILDESLMSRTIDAFDPTHGQIPGSPRNIPTGSIWSLLNFNPFIGPEGTRRAIVPALTKTKAIGEGAEKAIDWAVGTPGGSVPFWQRSALERTAPKVRNAIYRSLLLPNIQKGNQPVNLDGGE